jgi:hypothetical protein
MEELSKLRRADSSPMEQTYTTLSHSLGENGNRNLSLDRQNDCLRPGIAGGRWGLGFAT